MRWLLNFKNPEGQLARWIEVLTTYDMVIQHRPGSQHKNADALSRHRCEQCTGKEIKDNVNTLTTNSWQNEEAILDEKPLSELQQNDEDISLVRKLMDSNEKPEAAVISSAGSTVKSLWSQRQHLVIENDILYRKWADAKGIAKQAIIPLSERRKVLSYCHDQATSGHLGIRKDSEQSAPIVLLAGPSA